MPNRQGAIEMIRAEECTRTSSKLGRIGIPAMYNSHNRKRFVSNLNRDSAWRRRISSRRVRFSRFSKAFRLSLSCSVSPASSAGFSSNPEEALNSRGKNLSLFPETPFPTNGNSREGARDRRKASISKRMNQDGRTEACACMQRVVSRFQLVDSLASAGRVRSHARACARIRDARRHARRRRVRPLRFYSRLTYRNGSFPDARVRARASEAWFRALCRSGDENSPAIRTMDLSTRALEIWNVSIFLSIYL